MPNGDTYAYIEELEAHVAPNTEELRKKTLEYYIRALGAEQYRDGVFTGFFMSVAAIGLGILFGHCVGLKRCLRD